MQNMQDKLQQIQSGKKLLVQKIQEYESKLKLISTEHNEDQQQQHQQRGATDNAENIYSGHEDSIMTLGSKRSCKTARELGANKNLGMMPLNRSRYSRQQQNLQTTNYSLISNNEKPMKHTDSVDQNIVKANN